MDIKDLSPAAAAVVIWLPKGQDPKAEDFVIGDETLKAPPYPNPEAWWRLDQAVEHVKTAILGDHGKVPWIKTGDRVLSPDDVRTYRP